MANDILDDLMTADQSITLENPITQSTTTENAVTTLSQEELGKAKELSKSLDENNSQSVIEYGSLAQKKIGDFSQSV
ncbi:MAG: toxic anion resistance protein, partial [Lactococcus raffinolactis]